jgi:protein-S-isoprenylcysteine O-methyltransferase Ste14
VGGSLFALWGVRILSLYQSSGLEGKFVTTGPYRFTRNPQYVGDIVIISGFILVTNSVMSLIVGALGILLFILTPFCEEPWLKEIFGDEYQAYRETIPRFISLKSFRCRR